MKGYSGEMTVKLSDMKRYDWIMYNWVCVQEFADLEPKYIYAGLRPIEGRKKAAEQFDAAEIERQTHEKAN